MKKILLYVFSLFMTFSSVSAQKVLRGVVKDKDSRKGIPGVSISKKGEPIPMTYSTNDGRFSLEISDSLNTLQFSGKGYKPVELRVTEKDAEIQVVLTPAREIGGGNVKLFGSDISDRVEYDIFKLLKGKISGLQVKTWNGEPGSGSEVNFRGNMGEIIGAGNTPMVILNGVEIENNVSNLTEISALSAINVENVKRIEVLKDAAALTLFGSRGANGVILITTKDGTGQPSLEVKASTGVNFVPELRDVISGNDERHRVQGLFDNINFLYPENGVVKYPGFIVDSLNTFYRSTNDWQKKTYNPSMYQNYDVTLAGSGVYGAFGVAIDALMADGVKNETGFNRYSIDINTRFNVTKKFFFDLYTNATLTQNFNSPYNHPRPSYVPFHSDKDFFPDLSYISDKKYFDENQNNYVTGALSFNLALAKNLKVINTTGFYYRASRKDYYMPSTLLGYGGGRPLAYNGKYIRMSNNARLDHHLRIGNSVLNTRIGWEYLHNVTEDITARSFPERKDDISDFVQVVEGGADYTKGYSYVDRSNLVSGYVSLDYSYKEKYSLQAGLRTDGSSKFIDHRFSFYPTLGAFWNLKEEDFLKESKMITSARLHTSVGLSGVNPLDSYQPYGAMKAQGKYVYNGAGIIYPYTPDLKPIQVFQKDLRLQLGLWNRLSLGVEVYQKYIENITYRSIPVLTSGYDYFLKQDREGKVKGFDLNFDIALLQRGFTWDLGITASRFEMEYEKDGQNRRATAIYAYTSYGYYKSDSEVPVNTRTGMPISYENVSFKKGTPKITDLNKDMVIDEADQKKIADYNPRLFGGILNSFKYRNWSFDVQVDYELGGDIVVESESDHFIHFNDYQDYLSRAMYHGDGKSTPYYFIKRQSPDKVSIHGISSIEDASYLRVSHVKIGYDFGKKRRNHAFLSASNLLTFSNYSGLNADEARYGIKDFQMKTTGEPLFTTVMAGVRFKF